MSYGSQIRTAREAAKLSRRLVAIHLDVTEETIRKWEKGDTPIPVPAMDAIGKLVSERFTLGVEA